MEQISFRRIGKRRRVLVTGGAGFIGSNLIDRLIARGDEVICVDNLLTGSRKNIAHLLGHPRFDFLLHDVTMPLSVVVDEIYNLACPASPVHYQHDPIQTTRTSVLGVLNMLDLANKLSCKLLQASTSEVYGDPLIHPQTEDYWGHVNPIGPRACYDEGKRCAETLCMDYRRRFGFPVKIARIFNTYGPRMQAEDGRVVSNFILQALQGAPITIYGDGEQSRSFCYVDDLVDGLIALMDSPDDVVGPINLGRPAEFTIRELAEMTLRLTGSRSPLITMPLPVDDPRQRKPDISRARALLGWEPRVELETGLQATIDYFAETYVRVPA